MDIFPDDIVNKIYEHIEGYISYKPGMYLDVTLGDGDIGPQVARVLGMKRISSVSNLTVDDKGQKRVIPWESAFAHIDSDSTDVVGLFYTTHHLSDTYRRLMNKLAQVTKAGALLILTDNDVTDHNIADNLEWRHMYQSAANGEDYQTLREKGDASYTISQELVDSMRTFGFYLLVLVGNIGKHNQYLAIFRKSSAPSNVYIPTYTHPIYSIEAGNVHDGPSINQPNQTDEDIYAHYMDYINFI